MLLEASLPAPPGIATSSGNFTTSAANINTGVGNAVQSLQKQAIQTQRAAEATEDAIKTTKDQMRLDERAWIGVLEVDPGNFSAITGFPVVITLSNSGKTPARQVTFSVRYIYRSFPIPGPPEVEIANLEPLPAADIAPQGRIVRQLAPLPLSSMALTLSQQQGRNDIISHFGAINAGELILYYFGTVGYRTHLGNTT